MLRHRSLPHAEGTRSGLLGNVRGVRGESTARWTDHIATLFPLLCRRLLGEQASCAGVRMRYWSLRRAGAARRLRLRSSWSRRWVHAAVQVARGRGGGPMCGGDFARWATRL